VAVVVDPKDYGNIITQMDNNHGALPLATRKNLASKAYRHIADYDKAIADWFQGQQTTSLAKSSDKLSDKGEQHFPKHTIPLRYGENPHQTGNFLTDKTFALGAISQWQGKDLSYNNYLDLDAALRILYTTAYLRQPIAVIIKHTDPCGIAVAGDISSAFKKSFRTDPMSAFGGIIGVNRRLDEKLAQDILDLKIFFEIIIAPTIAPIAKKLLMVRKKLRLISLNPDDDDMFLHQDSYQTPDEKKYRSIMGGILQQDQDKKIINRDDCNLVAGDEPSVQEWQDLSLAMMVVKEMRSNAIAIVAGGSSLGLGGGATSRVMAAQKAVNDFLQKKHLIDKNLSPVVASDGFLPFSDNISIFAKGGIKAIIQPGGSINDDDIIANCKEKNIKLFFCHSRHFHH
ncbi:MAG: hypothetical protein ACR2NY_06760, partial [Alphaproteobacteria bacterium]